MSLFDSPEFNERLFFPRPDRSAPPDGARELEVAGDETLHVRCYRATAALPTVLLFHGNGEVVSDYDGGDDTMIVPAEARRAHAAAGATDKELVVIPAHGHNDVSQSPLYWEALQRFVKRVT